MNDYGTLAVNGYRWVSIHGSYASTTEKGVERLTNYRAGPTEAQIIEVDEAYYLIPGTIVHTMQIGMIGLGRMGTNMVRRLLQANHQDKLLSAMRFEFGGHREKSAN